MGFDEQASLLSPTGATIRFYRAAPAAGPARAVVQINHGLAEHGARYARFGGFLARRGFAAYAHDHRGHGHTTAPDAPRGVFGSGGAEAVAADVAAMHERIAADYPDRPIIVFGHSMGALIALDFVRRHPLRVAGAAIWNGNFSAGLPAQLACAILAWERFRLGSDMPSHILPRLTFENWAQQESDGRTPFDWLSHIRSEVDAYVADPLCGWEPSIGMWRAVFDLIFANARESGFAGVPRTLPFNLVGGGSDPATDGGRSVEKFAQRLRQMGFSNLISTIYPQTRHESLNELNRDLIMDAFARWAGGVAGDDAPGPQA